MGLSIVAVFLYAGSMSTSGIVAAQATAATVVFGWTSPARLVRVLLPSRSSSTRSRSSARPTGRRSTCPRRSPSWSVASTPSTRR